MPQISWLGCGAGSEAPANPSLRVYDVRHACATTWLRADVPMGEVGRRLGHSVETLVSTYVGALTTRSQRPRPPDKRDASDAVHRSDAVGGCRLVWATCASLGDRGEDRV